MKRRVLIWISVLGALSIGKWGLGAHIEASRRGITADRNVIQIAESGLPLDISHVQVVNKSVDIKKSFQFPYFIKVFRNQTDAHWPDRKTWRQDEIVALFPPVFRHQRQTVRLSDLVLSQGHFHYARRGLSVVLDDGHNPISNCIPCGGHRRFPYFDQDPSPLAAYESVGLSMYRNQSPYCGEGAKEADDYQTPSTPRDIPPRRFLKPMLRLSFGTIFLFAGFGLILRHGYDRPRWSVTGSLLFACGWFLLLAPVGWW